MVSIGDRNIRYIIDSGSIQRSCLIDRTLIINPSFIKVTWPEAPTGRRHGLDRRQVEALRVAGEPRTMTVTAENTNLPNVLRVVSLLCSK